MSLISRLVSINYPVTLCLLSIIWASIWFYHSPKNMLPKIENKADSSLSVPLPDFSVIQNISEKKQSFFEYLLPMVKDENLHILRLRTAIQAMSTSIKKNGAASLNQYDRNWLKALAMKYKVVPTTNPSQTLGRLLERVDTVPASMVLAQAAIESGWGTSRFAKQGNNLFGHWCFKKGCGLVPKFRNENQQHEVAQFETINESIRAYLMNLNSFSAYDEFRKLRAKFSSTSKQNMSSLDLLPGLSPYSEQAERYIEKVRIMIESNNLTQYDLAG